MQNVQPSDRLRKEIQTFFQDMGSADNGAEALSELRPYGLHFSWYRRAWKRSRRILSAARTL